MTRTGFWQVADAPASAKIQPAVDRRGLVERTELLGRLAGVGGHVSLVLLAAPAGYGKTTVLSQWAAAAGGQFGWVTVNEADSDPSASPVRSLALCTASGRSIRPCSGPLLSATGRITSWRGLTAVYRKLPCSARTEAVRRGRDLGLVEP
jgi:ATP/maltotriose-dependent transcriptional regulator MalT